MSYVLSLPIVYNGITASVALELENAGVSVDSSKE